MVPFILTLIISLLPNGAKPDDLAKEIKKEIYKYLREREESVLEPIHRLIAEKELIALLIQSLLCLLGYIKEKQLFDDMYARGETHWAV